MRPRKPWPEQDSVEDQLDLCKARNTHLYSGVTTAVGLAQSILDREGGQLALALHALDRPSPKVEVALDKINVALEAFETLSQRLEEIEADAKNLKHKD